MPVFRKILLVEDDRISRETLTRLLTALGHVVNSFVTAEQAEAATFSSPDIALLDVRLPGMQGDVLAHRLRQRFPTMRIIFISGELKAVEWELDQLHAEFLPKPLDVPKLLKAVAE
jgi:CheY-like chemotaxis protein